MRSLADQWLVTGDKAVENLKKTRDAAKANDLQKVQQIATDIDANNLKGHDLAARLGLSACAAA